MLLVPINSFGIQGPRRQVPPKAFDVFPSELSPYSINSTGLYQPYISVVTDSLAVQNSPYLMTDMMGYSRRNAGQQRVPSLPINTGTGVPVETYSQVTDARDCSGCSGSTPKPEKEDSILFSLLNKPHHELRPKTSPCPNTQPVTQLPYISNRSTMTRRCVGLQNAAETHKNSAEILEKTISFVKSLESFKNLGTHDQELLFSNCWAELFIVGMAQEQVSFGVIRYEISVPATVQTSKDVSFNEGESIKVDEADKLKSFIKRFTELQLSAVEYAYFMGTVLFNPDVVGLKDRDTIASLQVEAMHALAEYRGERVNSSPFDAEHHQQMRLAQILLGLPALRSIKTHAIAELFFRSHNCCPDILIS
ncbi:nuclear receptor subfamily 0 group B member 2-like isoform X1 [Styela clava]